MELRRPLTAAAASSLLIALMFIPSASASVDDAASGTAAGAADSAAVPAAPAGGSGAVTADTASFTRPADSADTALPAQVQDRAADSGADLADTGSIDTDPYLWGGAGFIGVGAALVVFARRRSYGEL
ncbi:hypothetical protein GCM10027168_35360 [Streptomyces capparidis]